MNIWKLMAGIALLGAILLLVSWPFAHDEHGVKWIVGGVGWFGFLLCVLAEVVLALFAVGRGMRRRAQPTSSL
ncbi:MAG TPA: hypothetical protein VFA05_11050 [Gaiellaceae bacterium]|nr:hypothetical protein [Gaiellaceae bacterium]